MTPARTTGRAAGLLLGMAMDAAFGDPRRGHPVAAFGRVAGVLERSVWAGSRRRGSYFVAGCVAGAAGSGLMLQQAVWRAAGRATGRAASPVSRRTETATETLTVAVATWMVLGGTSLRREAHTIATLLEHDRLDAARARLPYLCGRDPAALDEKGVARAVVESVAENTSDAVVAPLLWGAVAGVPGLLGYRAVNTLDAMVGHRSPRYVRFGWAAARLDDAANWVPARLTGLLTVAAAPLVGGAPGRTWRVLRRDGGRHPSPNAGRCEAAAAGALDVRLGGANTYEGRVDHRPELGEGPPPAVADIRRATRLAGAVGWAGAGLAASLAVTAAAAAAATAIAAAAGRRR